MSFCYGIYAKILTFCKPRRRNPTNREIHEKLFGSVLEPYTQINIEDYTSTNLIKCVQNVSTEISTAARKIIEENNTQKVADYFKAKIIDSQMIKSDSQTVLTLISLLLDIISKDDSISDDTKVELVNGSTKAELLMQETLVLPNFLAGLFLYVITVDNRKGKQLASKLSYEYFMNFSTKKRNYKIVSTIDKMLENGNSLITTMPNLDNIISQCNYALHESQRKIHIYSSWSELDFDSVYIIPKLTKKQSFRHEGNIIFGSDTTKGIWKTARSFPVIDYIPYIRKSLFNMNISAFSKSIIKLDTSLPSKVNLPNRKKEQPPKSASRLTQIKDLFTQDDIIYVVGGAGYGKSLFLKYLCVNPQVLLGFAENPLLIIQGDIKRLIRNDGTFRPMTEFLEECFINGSLIRPDELQSNLIIECLHRKRCLILLDALDEIGNDARQNIHRLIIAFFTQRYPGNKVCITSRERGFVPDENITWYKIESITVDDVEEYIDRFIELDRFDVLEKQHFLEQTNDLINSEFIKGFLTLSLLLAIYKNEDTLPSNKIALYQKCFEYMAISREQSKKLLINSYTNEPYDWKTLSKFMADATFMELTQLGNGNNIELKDTQIEEILSKLYERVFESSAEFKSAIKMFLQFCSNRTEIFIPSSDKNTYYKFYHRSFYEYFYSEFVVYRTKSADETYQMLSCFDIDSEIFELTTTLYQQKNPNHLYELMQYAFTCVEESHNYNSNQIYAKKIDILIMLMQTIDDKIFIRRFINFFLENAKNISATPLMTNFGLIYNIIIKDQKYFIEQYHFGYPLLSICIQEQVEKYL